MKGVGAFFKKWSKNIIVSLICTFMLCAGIGYAQVTRPLNIKSDFDAHAEEGIFITDASYKSGNNVSAADNTVGEFYSTIFNGHTALHTSDTGSYATFSVVIRNNYDYPYRFKKLDKITSIYTNEQIDCVASFPDGTDIVQSRDFITVDITFKYIENPDLSISSNTYADFSINIDFNIYIKPVLTDNMVPVEYNTSTQTWDMANQDSFGYADYDSGVWANAVTYNRNKAYSQNEYTTNGGTYFDGASYYIDYRNENYDFNHNITVGARFKSDGTGSGSLGYIICNLESAGFGLFVVHVNTTVGGNAATAGQLGFCYIDDSGDEYFVLSNSIVSMFTWNTLVATYDGTNVKIYVNGVLDKVEAHTGDIKPSEAGVNVGRNPRLDNTGNFYFDGNISHVMLLNDTLTDAECKQVYDTRFKFPTDDRNEIFNLDITSRDSNGKYFDGKYDGGYNLGLAGYSQFNTNNLAQFSIATKFNIFSLESTKSYLVCNMQTYGFGFGFEKSTGGLYFAFYDENIGNFIYASSSQRLDLKKWYTGVVTVDGYNIRMYIDGVEQQLTFKSGAGNTLTLGNSPLKLKNSTVRLAMGGNPDAKGNLTGDMFNGWIKDCVVFKKALSANEIGRDFSNDFAFHYKNYSTGPASTDVAQYVKYDYDNIILQSENSYTEEGIELNGVDDYICVGLGNHNFSSSVTMAIRLKFPTISTKDQALISNYEDGGFQLLLSGGKLRVMAKNRGSDSTVTTEDFTAEDFTVQSNTWYTIALVINSSGIHIFVDGVKIANITKDMNLANCMHPVFIGANPNPGNYTAMANIIVSDYAFINQAVASDVISQYFSGAISPSLARANCFLNFVGFEYREDNHSIPEEMITGHYTWIPRFKVKSTLESGEVDIEIVAKTTEAHDAFTFNGVELEGFWFSKFENSINASGNIQSVANADIYITDNISTMFNNIKRLENTGFNASNYSMLNIHMSKNSEWGAMAYFAQSKYGLFRTGDLATIQTNNSTITGYNYRVNTNQSTTQNITGIYDIVGGANEYVMANYDGTIGSSGFSSLPDNYYYDVYSTLDSYYNSNLHHAMGEIDSYPSDADSTFVTSSNPWLVRSGLFDYRSSNGTAGYSSRTVIAVVK